MEQEGFATIGDYIELVKTVLPFIVIFLLILRDRKKSIAAQSRDVWTLRKTKGKG